MRLMTDDFVDMQMTFELNTQCTFTLFSVSPLQCILPWGPGKNGRACTLIFVICTTTQIIFSH